jgi:hypothetical protein
MHDPQSHQLELAGKNTRNTEMWLQDRDIISLLVAPALVDDGAFDFKLGTVVRLTGGALIARFDADDEAPLRTWMTK